VYKYLYGVGPFPWTFPAGLPLLEGENLTNPSDNYNHDPILT